MRLITCLLFLFTCSVYADSVAVQVSIPVDQQAQPGLLAKAKVVAVRNALDKLPTVVWGSEQSHNGEYLEEIKAIGFAHAEVTVIKEVIDQAMNTYTLDARVAFDQEKVLATLKTVQEGVKAKRAIDQLVKMVGAIDVNDLVTNKVLDTQLAAKLLTDPKYLSDDLLDQVQWTESLLEKLKAVVYQRAEQYVQNIKVHFNGVKSMRLEYQVSAPAFESILPEFAAPDLNAFINEHKMLLLSQQNICIAKTIGDVDKINRFDIRSPLDFTVTTAIDKSMIKLGVQPFIFYLCDE